MDNNFITQTDHEKHTIKKYEFRNIDKTLEAQIAPSMEEKGIYTPNTEPTNTQSDEILAIQKILNEILQGNKTLETSLQALQSQIQTMHSSDSHALLEETKNSAYEQGFLEGEKKARENLGAQIQSQQQALVLAIQNLNEALNQSYENVKSLEAELSVIALDLAKEVIIKEVQEESGKIANEIAKELLAPIADSNEITLKVNPLDLPYLQEKLPEVQRINFKADPLIARGGVIISSPKGNFDGTILSRYKNLKRIILEEKGL
ncbi:flagellar assembly protein FliH [Helicobacter pylori]